MPTSKRLEEQWLSFRKTCFPPDLAKQQYIDLRRTFYGGAAACLGVLGQLGNEAKSVEDDLSEVQAELLSFNQDVKSGRA